MGSAVLEEAGRPRTVLPSSEQSLWLMCPCWRYWLKDEKPLEFFINTNIYIEKYRNSEKRKIYGRFFALGTFSLFLNIFVSSPGLSFESGVACPTVLIVSLRVLESCQGREAIST